MSPSLSIDVRMDMAYADALPRVIEALKAEGFGVLTRVDAHLTFREKLGIEFRPYTILGACNPPLAHKVLSQRPEAGLLLPCNVTVEDSDGAALVRIGDPAVLMTTGGMDEDPTIRSVGGQVRERLVRVAEALRG